MGKKGKNKKARKKATPNLHHLPAAHLIGEGEAMLAAGNSRGAIQVLKIACKKQPKNHQIENLLFRAYVLRQNQLRQKGMRPEAEALQCQLMQYRPDMARTTAAELLIYLKSTSLNIAISLYSQFLAHHPPVGEAEIIIAGALLSSADWQAAAALPENALLKRDLPILQEAVQQMNNAQWESALACLQPIGRRSPLAGIKMLCRAMVCFNDHDDPGMQRALAMIPDAFAGFPLVERLKSAPQELAPLWQGSFIPQEQIRKLLRAVKDDNLAAAARCIKQLARTIRPSDPGLAIEQLLCMLWPLVLACDLDSCDFAAMATALLPGGQGRAMATKFHFLAFEDLFEDTDDYLKLLAEQFPDPQDRPIAESMVLTDSVARVMESGIAQEAVGSLTAGARKRLGIRSYPAERALLEMVLKALKLDPHNPAAHELLTQLPHGSREAKKLAETGLLTMMAHLADDPQPCIALANLYYEKNAYRKAQECLRQARQRAPHDEQVRAYHVLALLRSIDMHLKHSRYHLIRADLEKAETLCTSKTVAQVTARRILFEMEQTGQLSLFEGRLQPGRKEHFRTHIEKHIQRLAGTERLKALAILEIDRRQRTESWNRDRSGSLEMAFRREAGLLKTLSSKAIRGLILPDGKRLPVPGGRRLWLTIFLGHYKKILYLLNHEDIFPLLDALLENGHIRQCLQELRRRQKTKTTPEPFQTLLQFYQLVVSHIDGKDDPDAETYTGVIEQAPQKYREMFRTAARRLSKFAHGALQSALAHFNFELLDRPCTCPVCAGRSKIEGLDSTGLDFLDLFDLDSNHLLKSLIDELEAFVDGAQLRGAPERELQRQRKVLMNEYQTRIFFGALAEMMPMELSKQLSAEARTLVFG